MEETNTNTEGTEGKKEQTIFDINLFTDVVGSRVFTDKRFPGGRIRLGLPAPTLEIDEDTNDTFKAMYNKDIQALINAGIVQNAYGERDWDILKYGAKKASECTEEEILNNIAQGLADINSEGFEDKARAFFEAAVFTEKRERTTDATKIVAKKLKSKGLGDITDEEIEAIIARRKDQLTDAQNC